MRSDFKPKHLQRAKETLSRQLETVTSTLHKLDDRKEKEQNKNVGSAFSRLIQVMKKVFQL